MDYPCTCVKDMAGDSSLFPEHADPFGTSSVLIGKEDQFSDTPLFYGSTKCVYVFRLRGGGVLSLILPTSPALILLVRVCNHDNRNAWIFVYY